MSTANSDRSRLPRLPANAGIRRTILGADRTLMAWVRTALSMISFGFTIYKFLQAAAQDKPLAHPDSPRQVGLFLIALGTASMMLGTFSYWKELRDLQIDAPFRIGRSALWIGVIVSIAGATLFITIVRRAV